MDSEMDSLFLKSYCGVVPCVHWGPWAVERVKPRADTETEQTNGQQTLLQFLEIFCCRSCLQTGTAVNPWQSACATPNNPHQEALNELDK